MLLQNKKQKIQKKWGTEDKVYQTDTIRPVILFKNYLTQKEQEMQQIFYGGDHSTL